MDFITIQRKCVDWSCKQVHKDVQIENSTNNIIAIKNDK